MNTGAADACGAALQPLGIGIQRHNAPTILHHRGHHQRFACGPGADIGHLHAGLGIAQHRGKLRAFILNIKQTRTEFSQIIGPPASDQTDSQRRQRRRMAFYAAACQLVAYHPPVLGLQRVDAQICCRLAAHGCQFGIGRIAQRGIHIRQQADRPFQQHVARHR